MKFLRTLFWLAMLVIIAIISVRNWDTYTPVRLYDDPIIWFRLPVLMVLAMLLGFLPYFLIHKASRWTMGRKLERVERQLAEVRSMPPEPSSILSPNEPASIPPGAAPTAVPPGVS
jgi:hypothetical protein